MAAVLAVGLALTPTAATAAEDDSQQAVGPGVVVSQVHPEAEFVTLTNYSERPQTIDNLTLRTCDPLGSSTTILVPGRIVFDPLETFTFASVDHDFLADIVWIGDVIPDPGGVRFTHGLFSQHLDGVGWWPGLACTEGNYAFPCDWNGETLTRLPFIDTNNNRTDFKCL